MCPSYVHQHKLGLMMMAWGADWPTGYGFLDQIVDGSAIKPSGGNNLMELNDPKINSALAAAIANTDAAARTKAWGDDRQAGHPDRDRRAADLPQEPAVPPGVRDERDRHAGVPRYVRLHPDRLVQVSDGIAFILKGR